MAVQTEHRDRLLRFFEALGAWQRPAIEAVGAEPDATHRAARERFTAMIDTLPYVDRPEHSMASSIFATAAMLATFEVLREHGIDAHTWGAATLALPPGAPPIDGADGLARARADAEASQAEAAPGEYVFEMTGPDEASDYGMNIRSCAVCHLFSRHEAMELVPYMCAFDDVMSDAIGQGLRRTGTLALGASHCDFRFRSDGEPLRLAAQYPREIRVRDEPK